MKKIISLVIVVLILGIGWFAFQKTETGKDNQAAVSSSLPDATAVTNGTYDVNTAESIINWEAQKPLIAGYVHHGTIGLKDGSITVADASTSALFTIDVSTIKVTSLGGGKEGKEDALAKHLMSKDFFEFDKYPTGTFTITSVTGTPDSATSFNYNVKGNLTLKGKTNPIEFPALIYIKDGSLHAEGSVTIDRTKWGINFGSGSIFQNLGNNLIDDQIKLTLTVIAKAKPELQ